VKYNSKTLRSFEEHANRCGKQGESGQTQKIAAQKTTHENKEWNAGVEA